MASLDLCYYKGGQRICPPSQPVGAMMQQTDSTASRTEKPDKEKVKKAVLDMLDRDLPEPPEGWTLIYIP